MSCTKMELGPANLFIWVPPIVCNSFLLTSKSLMIWLRLLVTKCNSISGQFFLSISWTTQKESTDNKNISKQAFYQHICYSDGTKKYYFLKLPESNSTLEKVWTWQGSTLWNQVALNVTLWYPVTLWYYRNDQLCNTCNADTQFWDRFFGGKPPNLTSSILKCLWILITSTKWWWVLQMTKYFRNGIYAVSTLTRFCI